MPSRIFALCFNCIVFVRKFFRCGNHQAVFATILFFILTNIDRCNLFCHFGHILKSTLFLVIMSLLKSLKFLKNMKTN